MIGKNIAVVPFVDLAMHSWTTVSVTLLYCFTKVWHCFKLTPLCIMPKKVPLSYTLPSPLHHSVPILHRLQFCYFISRLFPLENYLICFVFILHK